MSKSVSWNRVRHHWELYLFVLPAAFLVALFQYYPAASGIFHSFFLWNGSDVSEFVGLSNYLDLIQTSSFWDSFKIAFIIGGWNVVKMIPALALAVCIHRCRSAALQYFYRVLFVVPMVVPSLIIAFVWRSSFFEATNGYLNRFLISTHLMDVLIWLDSLCGWGGIFAPGAMPQWLGDPRLILVSAIIWGFPWIGSFDLLTHLAKLQGISKELYEAAEIDGVNWFSKFTRIELPLMMGSIYLMLVLVIINTIKDAGIILALAGPEGGPGGRVTVPALFMLRKAFIEQNMGYACAIGVVLTVVVMALQKLASFVLNWGSHSRAKIRLFSSGYLAVTALILWFAHPSLLWSFLLVAGAVWLIAGDSLHASGRKLLREFRRTTGSGEAAETTAVTVPAWNPRGSAARSATLRIARHAFIWIVAGFAFLPFYLMLIVSVKTNSQFFAKPGVPTAPHHWENWDTAWQIVQPSISNSLFVSILGTFLAMFLALAASYFFARYRLPLSGALWNGLLILMMMPTIANIVPLFKLLCNLNLVNTLTALIILGAAAGQAFAIFVLRNFIEEIPPDLFEAADIDGANHFQQMITIVLPLSGPILGTVGIMHFIGQWNDFVMPLVVMRDQSLLPVMVKISYLSGEYITQYGPLMASYTLASLPVVILFIFSMKLFVRGLTDGGVKG